jgi:hypothetical protein
MSYTSISKIKGETVKRVSTGHDELDWLYGLSKDKNLYQWGIPVRTISTWVGEGGVGKSRLAINLAKYKVSHGKKVLYLQNEVDLPTLAGWVGDTSNMQGFYCSEATALSEQVSMVKELRPDFVFVDSINLIDEFGSGTAKSIKTIVDGFRDAIEGSETHVVILCQLNKEGKATGSTALSHLPDINLHLTNTTDDGVFAVSIGKKHRYGRKGETYTSLWRHIETGVECISENRLADDRWFQPDGYKQEFIDFGVRRKRDLGTAGLMPNGSTESEVGTAGLMPGSGPYLAEPNTESAKVPVTLETCSPAVREAYHAINADKKPTFIDGVIKIFRKNWGLDK